jgi:hypothetical protein
MVGSKLSPGLEQVPSCEAKWNPRGEEVAFDAYRRCVGAVLPTRPSFVEVVRRAQSIVDALQANGPPHLKEGKTP